MCIYRGPYILIKLLIVNNRNFAIEDTIPGNIKKATEELIKKF
jgi:hypothetical protein